MWNYKTIIISVLLQSSAVLSLWQCTENSHCASIEGSQCSAGQCVCPPGQQIGQSGSACLDVSPYFTSSCVEDNQCWRLFTNFECRKEEGAEEGNCHCRSGFHYFSGRCWQSRLFEEQCTHDEECMAVVRDPYSMRCDGVCVCSEGYYLRQRGECRKIGYGVGDECVVSEDCQFNNGVCSNFLCVDSTQAVSQLSIPLPKNNVTSRAVSRLQGTLCDVSTPCESPFTCVSGVCVCPVGYYANDDGSVCLANLGSLSTEEQCVGFLAEVRDGVCMCPANFFYEENMRDCVKVARTLTDSCVTDAMCHTFGAASLCGPPQEPWFLRQCECERNRAVWDQERAMCRLFVGIGESCTASSDCMAGDMEIICVTDDAGEGVCTCPEGFVDYEGLCLTSGLELGDACQSSQECSGGEHLACLSGRCSCDDGYQEDEELAFCAPTLGGSCTLDDDCTITDSVCVIEDDRATCQCGTSFVEDADICWPVLIESEELETIQCIVNAQCNALLGPASACVNQHCVCAEHHHYRDGGCWPVTDLFESCSRNSECFLSSGSERVQCRNGLCQCTFEHPYSEELHTCVSESSAVAITSSMLTIFLALYFVLA